MMRATGFLCLGLLAFGACGAPGKEEPSDSFSELAGVDEKSDKFAGKFQLAGTLTYGEQKSVKVSASKVYGAFVFYGNGGDVVEINASAKSGSASRDSVLWLLDDKYEILKYNDDANGSVNSYIKYTLPAGVGRKYYAVARDYYRRAATFTVKLDGKPDYLSCDTDADCVKIQAGCCPTSGQIAVNGERQWEYRDQVIGVCNVFCIQIVPPPDYRVPACNAAKKSCELVEPKFCGGIAAFQCPDGLTCVDDPRDSCDPTAGGADCGGICQQCPAATGCKPGQVPSADGCQCEPVKDACQTNADCGPGQQCQLCWFSKQCIPDGAVC